MKMEVTEFGIRIYPENVQDKIYIEKFLGLKNDKDITSCTREDAFNLSCISYMEIKPKIEITPKDTHCPDPCF